MIFAAVCLYHLLASLAPQFADLQSKSRFFQTMAADNQKALAAVKTLACQFRTVDQISNRGNNLVTELLVDGQYLRKGVNFRSTYRYLLVNNRLQNCYLYDGIEIRQYERRTPPDRITRQEIGTKKSDDPGNIVNRLLAYHVVFNETDFNLFTFDELRSQPHQVLKAEIQKNGPLETRYLQLAVTYGTLEFWIDVNSHGWIRKMIFAPSMQPAEKYEREIVTFHRAGDGAVIPSVITSKKFHNGVIKSHITTTLTEIKLNEPLTDQEMLLPDVAGKMCSDLDKQVRYIVDEWGKRAGPEMSDPTQMNLPQPLPLYPDMDKNARANDSLSVADVMAIVLVASVVLIGLVWLVKSSRKARQSPAVTVGSSTPESLPASHRSASPRVRR